MTRARDLSKLANANVLSVDSSNNIGIGSTTPNAKLDVAGIGTFTRLNVSGIVTSTGGYNIGIQSGGTTVVSTTKVINFVGTGNSVIDKGTGQVDIQISGSSGGGSIGTTGITTQTIFSNPNTIDTDQMLTVTNHNYGVFGPVTIGAAVTVGAGNTFVIV